MNTPRSREPADDPVSDRFAEASERRRMLAAAARGLAFAAALASPLLVLLLLQEVAASRTLTFVSTHGRWLVLLGAFAGGAAVARARTGVSAPAVWPRLESALAPFPPERLALAVAALAFLLYLDLVPVHRRLGPVGGDEPKYLRTAVSLCSDLDADIAPVDERAPQRMEGARRLLRATAGALSSLVRGDSAPPGHQWVVGEFSDWIVAGWKGGHWYMQSIGLPILLAPTACVDQRIGDSFAPGPLTFATLGLLWAVGFAQTTRLAAEVSGSKLAGLAAGAASAFSAPLLVSAWHVYPEVAAAAAVPWLLRYARAGGPEPEGARVAALGLAAGGLPWLHPKFLVLALVLMELLLRRLLRRRRALVLAGASFALPLLALLLFEYHVTGLVRPEARYARHGDDVYRGPAQLLSPQQAVGAANAVFGARQGLLVIAPLLVGGALSLPLLWRRHQRDTVEAVAVFLSLLVAAAISGGHSPGPPARLMSPVACVPAAALAVGLVERRRWLPFRWTVIALVLVSLAITASMSHEWRRINNPWRGVPEAANVSRDLPAIPYALAAPARWALPPLVLAAVIALGARAVARAREGPSGPAGVEREVLALHVAWWASILFFAAGLAVVHL